MHLRRGSWRVSQDARQTYGSRGFGNFTEESEGLMINIRSVNGDPEELRSENFASNKYQPESKPGSLALSTLIGKENIQAYSNRFTQEQIDKRSSRFGRHDSQDSKTSVLTWAARARSTGSRSSAVLSQDERNTYRASLSKVNKEFDIKKVELSEIEKEISQTNSNLRVLEEDLRLLEQRSKELDDDLFSKLQMTRE
jgi:hypothetical protein